MISTVQCAFCKHYRSEPGRTCTAFPSGIPEAIWEGEHDHRVAYPGDHGIQLEMLPEYSESLLGPVRHAQQPVIAKAS